MPGAKNLVHLQDIVLVEQVVRIEHKIAVVSLFGEGGAYFLIEEFQGVALAHVLLVKALPNDCARRARDGGRSVRAVVGDHIGVHKLARIVLIAYALDEICDYRLFVAR